MARLVWETGLYETGIDRGVFYGPNGAVEPWNGLVSVQESPSDPNDVVRYLDGVKIQNRRKPGDFAGTIEAFTYPSSFEEVFTKRRANRFGFSYRTQTSTGTKIHLVYNALASPTDKTYRFEEFDPFSWSFTTIPMPVPGAKPTAHLIIDSSKSNYATIAALEDHIYGTESTDPHLPMPSDLINVFEENATVRVFDNGDGTFTITAPDEILEMLDATTFQIDWPSAVYIDEDTYTIRSL
jgi:hypothetical protein